MRKIKISDADVMRVAERIRKIGLERISRRSDAYGHSPAVRVLNSVLSLNLNYKNTVYPKLMAFQDNHPDVKLVSELANLIARYETPIDFLAQEFGFKHKPKSIMKANAIDAVANYLCNVASESPEVSEEVAIQQWAMTVKPEDYQYLGIKGFKIAGFQWLRMLFGANTTKPDVHINNFLSETLDREIYGRESVYLMEAIASELEVSVQALDNSIWRIMSKRRK